MTERQVNIAGVVTYWSLGEWSNVAVLDSGLAALSLGEYAPKPPSPQVATRRALQRVLGAKRSLVRPLEDGGYAVVHEDASSDDLDYDIVMRARPMEHSLDVDPWEHPKSTEVADAYDEERERVAAQGIGSMLTTLAELIGGVRLRDSGGVFWIPEAAADRWRSIAKVAEEAAIEGGTKVYYLRTAIDESGVRAVRDAIAADVQAKVEEIRNKVRDQSRESSHRKRAEEADAINARIAQYEAILGEALTDLRAATQEAEKEASLAALAALGGE